MEAIRCKSSSQVSSQVMIPLGLLIVLLVVGVLTKNSLKDYQSNYPVNMGKSEYCVKMIVACHKLQDRVETYHTSDELDWDKEIEQETIDENLDKYNRLGCVPVGLSPPGLRSFWNLVAIWEKQVKDLFLHQNLFGVIKEDDGGRRLKVTFGQLTGWCPDEDILEDTTLAMMTTSAEESDESEESTLSPNLVNKKVGSGEAQNHADFCHVSSTVEQWVRNEINGTLSMSSLTERFPDFEKLLHSTGYSCCPYKSVRNRVEIINDGIDILEDLQDLQPSEKVNYADIESDFHNLNKRLEHLKTGNANYSSGKCCPAFLSQFNSFQNGFQSSLKDFNPRESNLSLKGLLQNATTLEDQCSEQQNQLNKYIQNLNNNINKTDDTCCGEEENKIKVIEISLKDDQVDKSQQDLSVKINAVRENLAKTNKTLSDAENLLGEEAKQIEELQAECGKVSQRSSYTDSLRSNVSKLVDKLYDMEFIRTVDLSKPNPSRRSVNEIKKMYPSAFNNFQNVLETFEEIELKSRTTPAQIEKYVQDIETLKHTFQNVNMENSNLHVYHELFQVAAKETFQTYKTRHDKLRESVDKLVDSPDNKLVDSSMIPTSNSNSSTPDINTLEKDLVNLSQNVKNRKKEATGNEKKNEHLKNIKLFNEEIKKKKAQILERLDKLNQNKTEVDEDSVKLGQLEDLISQLSDRHASLAKRIADRHEVLQQHVSEMNKRIAAASAAAISCPLDCSLGDLPTVDALAARVKILEQKVKNYIKK